MSFEEDLLLPSISRTYQDGQDIKSAFKNLSRQFISDAVSNEQLDAWFENHQKGEILYLPKNEKYIDLFQTIQNQYSQFKKAIYFCSFNEPFYTFFPTNSRYAIKGNMSKNGKLDGFTIIDYFHGQKRQLLLENKPSQLINFMTFPKICIIGCDYVLMLDNSVAFKIYLFKLDLKAFSSKFLNEIEIYFTDPNVVFDEKDPTTFLIIGNYRDSDEDHLNTISTGRIENDKIQIHAEFVKINREIKCFKLEESKLSGLERIFNEQNKLTGIGYWEMNLNKPNDGGKINFEFKFDCEFDFKGFKFDVFAWSLTTCFIGSHSNGLLTNIYAFDVVVNKVKCILKNNQNVKSLHFNNETGVLTVQGYDALYRFPIGKPEKLQDIAWFKVRQLFMSSNNKFYNKTILKLPLNSEYRPFYFKL